MSYDFNKFVESVDEPRVFDTLIITYYNSAKTHLRKFRNEKDAKDAAVGIVQDWKSMPKTAFEIVDDFNIILKYDEQNAMLITRECDVIEATVDVMHNALEKWASK